MPDNITGMVLLCRLQLKLQTNKGVAANVSRHGCSYFITMLIIA